MTSSHLTEEAFLGLAGKKLSGEPLRAVEEHLSGCAQCRREYEEFCFAYSVVARMAEVGYQEALGVPETAATPTPKESKKAGRGFDFPWKSVIGVATACLCVMAFLFYPRFSPTVNAAELLSRASQNEDLSQDAKAFQVRIGDQTCVDTRPHKRTATFDTSVRCGRALQHIQSTPWGSGNPLSAKTYGTWRSALHQRKDHVTKRDASWELQTETDEGAVHTAMLELRTADYHPTKLTLGFTDDEEVSISEMASLPIAPEEEMATASMPLKADAKDDPSDLLEARAWAKLHQLHADSGWEAMVFRDGSEVKVIAVVTEDARKQELEAEFAAYPGIKVEIRSPSNPGDVSKLFPARVRFMSGSPALAASWLKGQFVDADVRAAFSNEALQASREILGRAFFLDALRQRQVALVHCSCVRMMTVLVAAEKNALGDSERQLSVGLEPMLGGALTPSSRVLTVSDAMHLDALLHELLWSGSDEEGVTFENSVQQVRDLLTQKKRGTRTVMAANRVDWSKH